MEPVELDLGIVPGFGVIRVPRELIDDGNFDLVGEMTHAALAAWSLALEAAMLAPLQPRLSKRGNPN